MALFYWSPHLETGNALIDEQHKGLFSLTNRLADAVAGAGQLPETAKIVDQLLAYARDHFCQEERLLCKALLSAKSKNKHVCAHRTFVSRISQIAERGDLSQSDITSELLEFLVTWLVGHILHMDHKMVRALPDAPQSGAAISNPSIQKALISALIETERRFRLIADQAPTMIWFSGPSGIRDFVNKSWREFIGVQNSGAQALDWTSLVHPDDASRYQTCLDQLLGHREAGEVEYRVKDSSGEWRWLIERIMPRFDGERFVGLVAASTDITMMKALTATLEQEVAHRTRELETLARTDPLTGLLNRRGFGEKLDVAIGIAERTGAALSLLYIDADHFKRINDKYGHAAGDEVLVGIACALDDHTEDDAILARVGGEEFVVVLPGANRHIGLQFADVIVDIVPRLLFNKCPEPISVSIGVAEFESGDTADQFVFRADAAVLTAKRQGRKRVATAQE